MKIASSIFTGFAALSGVLLILSSATAQDRRPLSSAERAAIMRLEGRPLSAAERAFIARIESEQGYRRLNAPSGSRLFEVGPQPMLNTLNRNGTYVVPNR